MKIRTQSSGFTIVELLIVVVVIAILAAITIVSYNGITSRAKNSAAQSGAQQGYEKVAAYAIQNSDLYPADLTAAELPTSGSTIYLYTVNNSANPKTFCLSATVSGVSYYVNDTTSTPTSGLCPVVIADGSFIQTVTSANCPAARIRAVDARDNHTYWVQKLADGKCWMLTNLAYAGGGTNTYGDTRTLTNGTGGSWTVPNYYVVPSTTNYTTEPTAPSTSTNGTGQYGYLYNWCGANGGQTGNGACDSSRSTSVNTSISVCPAGWRLPTGNGGEFAALNTAVNGGSTTSDAGLLANPWLGQLSGYWDSSFGFSIYGAGSYYWSSSQLSATSAYGLDFSSAHVILTWTLDKPAGFAVRCVAN